VAEAQGDLETAATRYRESLELDPSAHRVSAALARVLRLTEHYDEARTTLDAALHRFPSHPDVHLELATLLRQTGSIEDAQHHAEQALAAWEHADSNYVPAINARTLNAALHSAQN
jgi:tetratricopeptide (TPR) repeat protein